MHKNIYVNLPVKDLNRSIAFLTALGYAFNPQFTNEDATCLILGENLFAMLLVEPFFSTFTPHAVSDAHKQTEVLVCLSCDSREQVDALVAKALAAGASAPKAPQDHGFMYGHGFHDLDGHVWELGFMPAAATA